MVKLLISHSRYARYLLATLSTIAFGIKMGN